MTLIACDCSYDGSGLDLPSVSTTRTRTARKEHVCEECGGPIPKGAKYEYVRGRWDDEWVTHKTCMVCMRIREWYCPHGWVYGELAIQIEECLGFDYREVPDD